MLTGEGFPAVFIITLLGAGPFISGYLLYLGASFSQIGLVFAIPTLTNIAQIFMAYFSQKLKNRKWPFVFLASGHRLLWVSTGLIPFLFEKEWWIPIYIALYSLAFLANAGSVVIWSSLVGDMVVARVRGRYFGIRNTILNAVICLILFGGGYILETYPGGKGFEILFIIAAVFGVINIITFTMYPNLPFEKSTETRLMPMLKKPLSDRSFMIPTLFLSLWGFLQNMVIPFFSTVMLKLLDYGQGTVSVITVLQTLAMTASFYIWGNLNNKYGNKQLLFWTLPIIALSCLLWGFIAVLPSLPVLILLHAVFGIGIGGYNQLVFNFVIGDTPKSERPMYIAVFSAITGAAAFVGPLLGGWVYDLMESLPAWTRIYGTNTLMGILLLLLAAGPARKILNPRQQV